MSDFMKVGDWSEPVPVCIWGHGEMWPSISRDAYECHCGFEILGTEWHPYLKAQGWEWPIIGEIEF